MFAHVATDAASAALRAGRSIDVHGPLRHHTQPEAELLNSPRSILRSVLPHRLARRRIEGRRRARHVTCGRLDGRLAGGLSLELGEPSVWPQRDDEHAHTERLEDAEIPDDLSH